MFYEAKGWIWDRDRKGPFTFEAICETLEIELERFAQGPWCANGVVIDPG